MAVAYGEGAVWVSESGADQVQRIDPVKRRAIKPPIQVGFGPSGIAAGEGAVWVANQFKYTVSRIDPATNKVVATIKVGIQPTDVAIGEGAVWVANSNSNSVTRIDPKTNQVVATIKLKGEQHLATWRPASAPSGSPRPTPNRSPRSIRRSNKQTDEIKLQGDSPEDVAVGFGAVWLPIAESNFLLRVKT